MADNLHLMALYLFGKLSGSPVFAYNLYYLLSAGLIAVSMAVLMRLLRFDAIICIVSGVLFSALPFAYSRFTHLFLVSYYQVPLIFWFLLAERPLKKWHIFVVSLVVGFSGIYYSFFACCIVGLLILADMISGYIRSRSLKSIYSKNRQNIFDSALFVTGITFSFFVCVGANIFYRLYNGTNQQVAHRVWTESVWYSLRPEGFLLPMTTHRFSVLAGIKEKLLSTAYFQKRIVVEGFDEYIGAVAIIGLLGVSLVLGYRFFRRSTFFLQNLNGEDAFSARLVSILLACLFLAFPYGLGSWFARFVSPQIRAYDRMSIFVGCLGIISFFFLFKKYLIGKHWYLRGALVLTLIVGLWDQTPKETHLRPLRDETQSDIGFSRQVEATVGTDSGVLFLPYITFPEHAPIYKMEDYSPLKIAIHSNFRSSYPAMRGRSSDEVLKPLFYQVAVPDVQNIKKCGFSGVIVDRFGYDDGAAVVESYLQKHSNIIFESKDRRFVFYKIDSQVKN